MTNLISVIIPVYNVEKEIQRCIDSVLKQTYHYIEVIVINDGSSDQSLDILKQFDDDRLKIVTQTNGGAASARNNGIQIATGEYVAFIDGDDWIETTFLEKMAAKMKPGIDLVVCDYKVMNYDGTLKEIVSLGLDETIDYSLDKMPFLINSIGNAPWNKLYRLNIIKKDNLIYPEGYRHHDMAFTQSYLLEAEKVAYVGQSLNFYLADRPNNISTSYDIKIDHILVMLNKVIETYKSKNLFECYYEELKYLSCSNITSSLRKIRYLNDKKFVNNYINRVFQWYGANFPDYRNSSYAHGLNYVDKVYMNKKLLKLYYIYLKRLKNKQPGH